MAVKGAMGQRDDGLGADASSPLLPGARVCPQEEPASVPPGYLPADYVAMVFAIFNLICVIIGFDKLAQGGALLAGFSGYLIAIVSLRWLPSPRFWFLRLLRDAHALFAIGPAYAVAEVISQGISSRYFDSLVIGWDRAIFGGHPNIYLAATFPWTPLSEALHLCYWLYLWLLPTLGFTLYGLRRYASLRTVATTVSANFFLCQFVFLLFPVLGPYYTFPHIDAPGSLFPSLVYSTLENASIGTAFPSSHCAAASVMALMAWRFAPRGLALVFATITLGILIATVYGGFHYAIDSVVGTSLGLAMAVLGPKLHRKLLGRGLTALSPLRDPQDSR